MLENEKEIEDKIRENLEGKLEIALHRINREIIEELPNGQGSSISDDLKIQKVKKGTEKGWVFQVWASKIWRYLNDGTGIFNPAHAGMGAGGRIKAIYAKALHFKNQKLARALGFPTEDVFLKSVKGITPRFFWDRHYRKNNLMRNMAQVR